jgi:hypothetical protein
VQRSWQRDHLEVDMIFRYLNIAGGCLPEGADPEIHAVA